MPAKTTVESRIERLSRVDEKTGCWVWIGCLDKDRYGKVRVMMNGRYVYLAHRMTYIHFIGEIPPEMEIDHKCKNRSCINPKHLEAISHTENIQRSEYKKENHRNYRKTHCKHGHEFTEENTRIEIWKGIRMRKCLVCYKAKNDRSNSKRKLMKLMGMEVTEL